MARDLLSERRPLATRKSKAPKAKKASKTAKKAAKKATGTAKKGGKKAVAKKAPAKKAPAKKAVSKKAAKKTVAKKTAAKKTPAKKAAAASKAPATKAQATKAPAKKAATKKAPAKKTASTAAPAKKEPAKAKAPAKKSTTAKPAETAAPAAPPQPVKRAPVKRPPPKPRPIVVPGPKVKKTADEVLLESAERVAKGAFRVKPSERVLLLTDASRIDIVEAIAHWCDHVRAETLIVLLSERVRPFRGLSGQLRQLVGGANLVVSALDVRDEEAAFNNDIVKVSVENGRFVSLAGLHIDSMKRLVNINYGELQDRGRRVIEHVSGAREVRVSNGIGTDVVFSVNGRRWMNDNGDYSQRGQRGALPAGGCFAAPVEASFQGTVHFDYVDGKSGAGSVTFKDGRIADASGKLIEDVIKKVGRDPGAKIIGGFGLGTNPQAELCECANESSKAEGAATFYIGDSRGLGDNSSTHRHAVFVSNATVVADGVTVTEDGRFSV